MKAWLSTLIVVMAITSGCRKAVFKNIEEPQAESNSDSTRGGGGTGTGDGEGSSRPGMSLVVKVPVKELPFASSTTATATTKEGVEVPSTWSVVDPSDDPIGTIDSNGTFKAPSRGDPIIVRIIAVSKKDPTLKGEVLLPLISLPGSEDGLGLIVKVPVPSVKVGSKTVTATAELKDGTRNPPVKWSVTGPGTNFGKIDEKSGVYTSPATGSTTFDVIISASLNADPSVTASTTLKVEPVDASSIGLVVTVPSPDIKAGGNEMQATAKLKDGTLNPPVKWTIMGPGGRDAGSINDKGVYRSPSTTDTDFPVVITATLIANEAVKGSTTINVRKNDAIFFRCVDGSKVAPIKALVYKIPDTTKTLPKNWSTQDYQTTVCLDRYYVPRRNFMGGFPDLPKLEEWFGMTTTTDIIIPKDGTYQFRMTSDDGAILWIDGKEVANLDGVHQVLDKEGSINLKAGKRALRLDYFQGPKYEIALMLYWKKPGDSEFTVVPTESFE